MSSREETKFTSKQHRLDMTTDNKIMQKNSERQSFDASFVQGSACLNCVRQASLKQFSRPLRISSSPPSGCYSPTSSKFSTSLNFTSSPAITVAVILAFATMASGSSIVKNECDPLDANSCKYGATCEQERGRSRLGKPYYRCVCPQINCFNTGLFDPVCGERGGVNEKYFNVLCLMLEECALQQPIRQVCYGICGEESCVAITSENLHHASCPPKDASLCLNGGLCVYHTLLKESSCRCPNDYTGDRCETRKPPLLEDQSPKNEGSNCDGRRELLIIFAIVLLALILILIVVCMCWRSRGSKKRDDVSLWDSKETEREETTPLRESKRSDYLFPENERRDVEK